MPSSNPSDAPARSDVAVSGPIVLVGMMASGKTTVGRRLGELLGRAVYDSDQMIEARVGRTVAQLWEDGGEAAFRRLETEALEEALSARPPGVVAAAGGVVLTAANRRRLRRAAAAGAVVVWLQADPDTLAGRVHPGDHRPLLADDATGTLRRLTAERAGLYAEVADLVVPPGSIDDTVAAVAAGAQRVAAERAGGHR
jgi:shikimate kinase